MMKIHISKKIWFISIVLVIFVGMIAIFSVRYSQIDKSYCEAQTLVDQSKYSDALQLLEQIEEHGHKDTESLIVYCESYIAHEKGRSVDAYYEMKNIRFHHQSGEMNKRICDFKEELETAYNKYIKDMADRSMREYQAKKQTEQATKKTTTKKTTKPYTSKKTDDDPYEASKYRNEEDFYDDHYYDFHDYYDAEKYYREHHD